jgi:hypothetical protein
VTCFNIINMKGRTRMTTVSKTGPDALRADFSTEALVERFIEIYGPGLRFISGKNQQWMVWDGAKWHHDERHGLAGIYLAKHFCRAVAALCVDPFRARKIAEQEPYSIARMAEASKQLAPTAEDWSRPYDGRDYWALVQEGSKKAVAK